MQTQSHNAPLIEAEIRRINTGLAAVARHSRASMGASESGRSLLKRLRFVRCSLLLSEILRDCAAIAVTGLQGVGKSTLVRNWLNLPADVLPVSLSRDEILPILIREHDGPLSARVAEERADSGGDSGWHWRSIAPTDIPKIARGGGAGDRAEEPLPFLIELWVPLRQLHDSRQGLVLLPGLEHRDTTIWEPLARHALFSSATCVFVTTGELLADGGNDATFDEIRKRFEGIKPIVVVTHADTANRDTKDAWLKGAAERFEVPASERAHRVLATGDGDGSVATWGPQLLSAIRRFGVTSVGFRRTRDKALEQLLDEKLGDVLGSLQDLRTNESIEESEADRRLNRQISVLQRAFGKARKAYVDLWEGAVATAVANAKKDNTHRLIGRDWFDKAWDEWFGNDLKSRTAAETRLTATWAEHLANQRPALREALGAIVADGLGLERTRLGLPELGPARGARPSATRSTAKEDMVGPEVRHNLVWLSTTDESQLVLPDERLSVALQAVPYLCVGLVWGLCTERTLTASVEFDGRASAQLPTIFETIKSAGSDGRRVAATVASLLLGVDVADGQVDSLPALAQGLGLSAAAANYLVAAAAVWAVGQLVWSAYTSVMNGELERDEREKNVLSALGAATRSHAELQFDVMEREVTDRIRRTLEVRLGVTERQGRAFALDTALAAVETGRSRILGMLESHATVLG